MNISLEECERDLELTKSDLAYLQSVESAVSDLLSKSSIENKDIYFSTLRKVQSDIYSGQKLISKIDTYLKSISSPSKTT